MTSLSIKAVRSAVHNSVIDGCCSLPEETSWGANCNTGIIIIVNNIHIT